MTTILYVREVYIQLFNALLQLQYQRDTVESHAFELLRVVPFVDLFCRATRLVFRRVANMGITHSRLAQAMLC